MTDEEIGLPKLKGDFVADSSMIHAQLQDLASDLYENAQLFRGMGLHQKADEFHHMAKVSMTLGSYVGKLTSNELDRGLKEAKENFGKMTGMILTKCLEAGAKPE